MSKSKKKICVVVNSRANYGRVKSVMAAIRDHPELELQLIVGASALLYRFGMVADLIAKDGFEIATTVYSIVEGETPATMAKSTGLAIIELATQFENLKPDLVLTVADRFETMATAVAASYMNIPLAHTQGGEVTGSIDESVRHAVTKLANLHFPATRQAADFIVRMGEEAGNVWLTGCPAIDLIADLDYSGLSDIFGREGGVGANLDPTAPYLVVMQHPVTTEYGQGLAQINETLRAVASIGIQAVWLWPNVDAGSEDVAKGMRVFREHNPEARIHFYRHLPAEDYARLMHHAACIVGNSSSALREGAFLGTPAVDIGTRQSGREHGPNVVHASYDAGGIEQEVRAQIAHGRYPSSHMFGDGKAGPRIAEILAGAEIKVQKQLSYLADAGERSDCGAASDSRQGSIKPAERKRCR